MTLRLIILLLLIICVVQAFSSPFLFDLTGNNNKNNGISTMLQAWKSQEQANNIFSESISKHFREFLNNILKTYRQFFENFIKNINSGLDRNNRESPTTNKIINNNETTINSTLTDNILEKTDGVTESSKKIDSI